MSVPKTVAVLVPLVAVIDALVSGGWWAVLGWTAVAVTLIVLAVRAVRHAPGVQHAGAEKHEPVFVPPVHDRLAYSNRH
jgi:hypothetical protein